jgi:hypothetical protein
VVFVMCPLIDELTRCFNGAGELRETRSTRAWWPQGASLSICITIKDLQLCGANVKEAGVLNSIFFCE